MHDKLPSIAMDIVQLFLHEKQVTRENKCGYNIANNNVVELHWMGSRLEINNSLAQLSKRLFDSIFEKS